MKVERNVSVIKNNSGWVIINEWNNGNDKFCFESWVKENDNGYSRYLVRKNGVEEKSNSLSGKGIKEIVEFYKMEEGLIEWFLSSRKGIYDSLKGKSIVKKNDLEIKLMGINEKLKEIEEKKLKLSKEKEEIEYKINNFVESNIDFKDLEEKEKERKIKELEEVLKSLKGV